MAEEETVVNGDGGSAANKYTLVTDSFDGMVKCQDPSMKCDGAPNWRRLAGFPIYATGQPNQADLDKCVEQAVNKFDEQKAVLWVNCRQEPVLYVNGKPFSVRETGSIQKHLEMNEAFAINNLENDMAAQIKKGDGSFTYFKDMVGEQLKEKEVETKEEKAKADKVTTLSELFSSAAKKEPKLESSRIPIHLNKAPADESFDLLTRLLKGQSSAVPVIFNCQGGISRSSTASVIAGIIKEALLEVEFAKMRGVIPDNIIDGLRDKKTASPSSRINRKTKQRALEGRISCSFGASEQL